MTAFFARAKRRGVCSVIRFMKYVVFFLLIFSSFVSPTVFSQTPCTAETVKSANLPVGEIENHVYKTFTEADGDRKRLRLGIVRPADAAQKEKRPLVIGLHSGGFLESFCRNVPCYVRYSSGVLAPNFARKGFVTASVEYRLTSPLDFIKARIGDDKIRETEYKAAQDARAAIRYVFENADRLGIDRENVFLMGTSAGAITALHAAYLDTDEAPKDLVRKYGSLEPRWPVRGVVSLAGALADLNYLAGGDRVPLLIVHGREDYVVPFERGNYLRLRHLKPVFGGKAVYDEALRRGIPAKGLFYDFGHSVPDKYKAEVYAGVNDFLRANLKCAAPDRSKQRAKK